MQAPKGDSGLSVCHQAMSVFCGSDSDASQTQTPPSSEKQIFSPYLAAPAASHAAMDLASASFSAWGGMGIGPQTPELPATILAAR